MSFNIRMATVLDGPNRWERRREALLKTILGSAPDILGCQEVSPMQRRFLEERLAPEYVCVGSGRDADGRGEQTPIFWRSDRLELDQWWNFWLSPTPLAAGSRGWDAQLPRICTLARLRCKETPAHSFLVANTHLDHRGRKARGHSSRLLLDMLAQQRQDGDIQILLGDFNALEGEPSMLHLRGALQDTFRKFAPRAGIRGGGTFHAFLGPYFPLPPRIDYIFADPRLQVENCLVVRRRGEHKGFPSDHYPVVAELAW